MLGSCWLSDLNRKLCSLSSLARCACHLDRSATGIPTDEELSGAELGKPKVFPVHYCIRAFSRVITLHGQSNFLPPKARICFLTYTCLSRRTTVNGTVHGKNS